jgi:hypothetical protein
MELKKYIGILFSLAIFMMASCAKVKKIKDTECSKLNSSSLTHIKQLLENSVNDTANNHFDFFIDYSREDLYLIDKKNKWELNFSGKYFDIRIKFFNSDFVVLYCVVSGVMNGLTLNPIDNNNLYIINRRLGKKLVAIESKEGISSAIIEDGLLYFECYNPHFIRFYQSGYFR